MSIDFIFTALFVVLARVCCALIDPLYHFGKPERTH
jgi:hypothetical protein